MILYDPAHNKLCAGQAQILFMVINMSQSIKDLITDFLEHCEVEKNHSPLTIQNYHHYLTRFLEFCQNKTGKKELSATDIDLDLVRSFRLFLNRLTDQKGESLKKITQNYHLIALRAFLKYLARRDIKSLAAEKIELGKAERKSIGFLEGDDVERLLAAPFNHQNKTAQTSKLRDKAILETLFSTGLRVSELVNLDRDHINLVRGEFLVRGKGGKERIVFLSPEAANAIQKYLDMRGDSFKPLFANSSKGDITEDENRRLTARSIQRLIQKYARIAGIIKKVTPHVLRHSYATDLLISGADIRSVQAMLGHASITTTQIYTHITNKNLREIHQAFHRKKKS